MSPPGRRHAVAGETAIPSSHGAAWLVPTMMTVEGAAAASASQPAAAFAPEYTSPACGTRMPSGPSAPSPSGVRGASAMHASTSASRSAGSDG